MLTTRLPRPLYIIYRFGYALFVSTSRLLNAGVFGGSTSQTLSARCHLEAPHDPAWARRRKIVNAMFFWQEDHCATAWADEIKAAERTIEINQAKSLTGVPNAYA